MEKVTVDIIIPSFNGRHLLEQNLPEILGNAYKFGKLIVIDNGSKDNTVGWLNENYPEAIIVRNKTNLGYTKPINQGIAKSDSEFFVLINNDVSPKKGYISESLPYFDDPEVFAVTFHEEGASWPDMQWRDGKMQYSHGQSKDKPVLSPWASGGSAIFRKKIWKKLGGLDEIYTPFYWEDIDIGYRAWRTGYKIIWEPKATVVHDHESTAKKLNQNYVSLIKERNELLFNWLNVTDPSYVLGHIWFLITYTLGHPGYSKVILSAIWRRLSFRPLKRNFIISDKNVLSIVSKPI